MKQLLTLVIMLFSTASFAQYIPRDIVSKMDREDLDVRETTRNFDYGVTRGNSRYKPELRCSSTGRWGYSCEPTGVIVYQDEYGRIIYHSGHNPRASRYYCHSCGGR